MSAPTVESLRARVTEKGPWFVVKPASKPFRCRSCGTWCYWVVTATGKRMLADTGVQGGTRPTETEFGRGVAHFATCPEGPLWKAKR